MRLKNILFLLYILFFTNNSNANSNLSNTYITAREFIILKYDLFYSKYNHRILKDIGLMVKYQYLSFNLKMNDNDQFLINIVAVMDKQKYKKKRYYPKNKDCNIVRNKLFLNKYGYSFWKRKRNYSFDEEDLKDVLKKEILSLQNLSENKIEEIIKNTNIQIDIIHPKPNKSISCKGNIAQVVLD